MDVSRRRFLRGEVTPSLQRPLRPPWAIDEDRFVAGCSRCGDCIQACPQQILIHGDGAYPTLDFSQRECTFCRACTDACSLPLFNPQQTQPWQQVAEVGEHCLTHTGIVCQNCKDACEPRAILFRYQAGGIARPHINLQDCTGCGACIAPCPNNSMSIVSSINPASSPA